MVYLYYVVTQINPVGNGSSMTIALITDPKVDGTSIRGTKVGEVDWEKSSLLDSKYVFKKVTQHEIIFVGNLTCEQCLENPFE